MCLRPKTGMETMLCRPETICLFDPHARFMEVLGLLTTSAGETMILECFGCVTGQQLVNGTCVDEEDTPAPPEEDTPAPQSQEIPP